MHLSVRFSTEKELKQFQDLLYEKSGQGVSFTGLLEAMVSEVTIVTAVHNIKSNNPKVGNMVMLGAYVAATGVLKKETIEHMITDMFTGKKAKLVPLNMEALNRGMACITQ